MERHAAQGVERADLWREEEKTLKESLERSLATLQTTGDDTAMVLEEISTQSI